MRFSDSRYLTIAPRISITYTNNRQIYLGEQSKSLASQILSKHSFGMLELYDGLSLFILTKFLTIN